MNAAEMYEKGIKEFLEKVDRREKAINDNLDNAWKNLNRDTCDAGVAQYFVDDIKEAELWLNECKMVRYELNHILEEVEEAKKASTPDGWYKE